MIRGAIILRRIILISGKQGVGKTTLANDLKMVLQKELLVPILLKFAAPIYKLHDAIYSELAQLGMTRKNIDGTFMQFIGEHIRNEFGQNVWVDIVTHQISKALLVQRAIIVVDDLRYPNEADVWSRNECCMVRLEASEEVRKARAEKWRPNTDHPSETGLDTYQNWDMRFNTEGKRVPFKHAMEILAWIQSKNRF